MRHGWLAGVSALATVALPLQATSASLLPSEITTNTVLSATGYVNQVQDGTTLVNNTQTFGGQSAAVNAGATPSPYMSASASISGTGQLEQAFAIGQFVYY